MRRSMTAYGRALHQSKLGRWTIDVHSVNRKGLDLNIQLPSTLLFLDPIIRKWVGEAAERGQVTVRVAFEFLQIDESIGLLQSLKQKWESIAEALGFGKEAVDFEFLMERVDPQMMPIEEKPLKDDLHEGWSLACKNWVAMKEKEGETLVSDIKKRMEIITNELQEVQKLQPKVIERYRKKIEDRMKELKIGIEEERLLREAAMLAEKADITEEITRLYSHLEQMEQYLCSKEKSVGRTLDFLAQEMGREVGTLMAKAGETAIAKIGVVIKSEVEKIREQVQNIE